MFRYKKTIIESDLDFYGHVNNARYLSLFEEARWDFATNNGFGFEDIKVSDVGFVVLRANKGNDSATDPAQRRWVNCLYW